MALGAASMPDAPDGIYDGGLPLHEVFGVPVHPVVVHSAAVLLPLAAIGLILAATSIKRSKRYAGAVALIATAGFITAFLAIASGRDLAQLLGASSQEHFRLGEWVPWFAMGLLLASTALWLIDKKPPKRGAPGKIVALLAVLVSAATMLVTVWTSILGLQLTWG